MALWGAQGEQDLAQEAWFYCGSVSMGAPTTPHCQLPANHSQPGIALKSRCSQRVSYLGVELETVLSASFSPPYFPNKSASLLYLLGLPLAEVPAPWLSAHCPAPLPVLQCQLG